MFSWLILVTFFLVLLVIFGCFWLFLLFSVVFVGWSFLVIIFGCFWVCIFFLLLFLVIFGRFSSVCNFFFFMFLVDFSSFQWSVDFGGSLSFLLFLLFFIVLPCFQLFRSFSVVFCCFQWFCVVVWTLINFFKQEGFGLPWSGA